jgi:heat shock protein HtpX
MTLYTQVASNRLKTVWYLFLFSLIFLAVAWGVSWYFGSYDILFIAAIVVIIQGIVSYWYSDSIALLTAKAQPLAQSIPAEQVARVTKIVENLAITAGLPQPRLYIIPDTAMNAFATGRNPEHAAIAMTAGLLSLNDNELAGVLAHELSHIGNEDIRLMSMVMVMAGLIALISDLFLRNMFWGRRRDSDNDSGGGILIIVAIVLALLAPLAATLIQLAISRKREFMADATGVLITRYPEGLISALRKISADKEPLEVANRGNAHMYFTNPLHNQWFASLFDTHPPVAARIEALEAGSR